jgi:hypothetical protein
LKAVNDVYLNQGLVLLTIAVVIGVVITLAIAIHAAIALALVLALGLAVFEFIRVRGVNAPRSNLSLTRDRHLAELARSWQSTIICFTRKNALNGDFIRLWQIVLGLFRWSVSVSFSLCQGVLSFWGGQIEVRREQAVEPVAEPSPDTMYF